MSASGAVRQWALQIFVSGGLHLWIRDCLGAKQEAVGELTTILHAVCACVSYHATGAQVKRQRERCRQRHFGCTAAAVWSPRLDCASCGGSVIRSLFKGLYRNVLLNVLPYAGWQGSERIHCQYLHLAQARSETIYRLSRSRTTF